MSVPSLVNEHCMLTAQGSSVNRRRTMELRVRLEAEPGLKSAHRAVPSHPGTLSRELFPNRLQFLPAFSTGPGVCHSQSLERIEDNLRNDQPCILFVVGGN